MIERIPITDGRDRAIQDQVERDFCAVLMWEGDVDRIHRMVTRYINFRDGKVSNPYVDRVKP